MRAWKLANPRGADPEGQIANFALGFEACRQIACIALRGLAVPLTRQRFIPSLSFSDKGKCRDAARS